MSFVYEALKKAEREGNINSAWISQPKEELHLTHTILELPEKVVKDFLKLKQNMQLAHTEQNTQIIAITSSVSGEGCSTIAYFLALMLSQSTNGIHPVENQKEGVYYSNGNGTRKGRKGGVLLIDGNLERPSLHQVFGVDQRQGLTEFVLTVDSKSVFTKTVDADHLNLITSGKTNGNWHDIWGSEKIKGLMDKLRDQFEYVLIDAPPVIGHPETLALSKLTDGVLFIIKAGQTRWEVLEEAKQQLANAGVKVLGVVLNERKYFIPQGIYRRI